MPKYVFQHGLPTESERMDMMAAALDDASRRHLGKLPIEGNWSCLEIGSGNGSLSAWLAPQVPSGQIMVTDIQPDFIEGVSGPNIVRRRLDIVTDTLPNKSHDLIFMRAVLHHIPERQAILDKLVGALRPGGWLFIHEPDLHPAAACSNRAVRQIWEDFFAWTNEFGIDYTTGRRIPEWLQTQGMTNISAWGDTAIYPGNSAYAKWLRVTIAEVSERMLEAGKTTPERLQAFDLASHDPKIWQMSFSFVGTLAQRPGL